MTSDQRIQPTGSGQMGVLAATSLGIGGMVGAGLYTLLGFAATTSGAFLPVAFVIAGAAASFSVYSYARLGMTYPSRGGAARFLLEEYGDGTVAGGLNVLQFLGYLIATSLYAAGFAEYVRALSGDTMPSWAVKLVGVGAVVVFAGLNLLGSRVTGRAETAIVGLQAVILIALVVLGLFKADPEVISQSASPSVIGVIVAGALLFNTYQGFGVVTNAAGEMSDPRKQLPRAMFAALIIVGAFYLIISTVLVATVPAERIQADSGHVLADFGDVVAGHVGFVVISVAALLAAASAVNATIFAASNVGYAMAEKREMSRSLTRTVWRGTSWSLVVSSAIVSLLVLFFPLQAVGSMTSLAFLLLYGAVNAGHLRLRHATGARAWPLVAGVVVNALLFIALLGNAISQGQTTTWVALILFVVGSFAFEAAFRAHERRRGTATT